MVGAALAFCAGVALSAGNAAWCGALLVLLALLRPRLPFQRPQPTAVILALLVLAGYLHGAGAGDGAIRDAGLASAAGETIRAGLRERVAATFPNEAPMVEALLLAERRRLDPELRRAFARAGAAHLLAISGFHVGILAGWVVLLLHSAGLGRARTATVSTLVVWAYVALLGFPTSAVRAGLLLSAAAAGRIRGRPVHPLGAWGLALLMVATGDPSAITSAGAQLSFAGALGLILWAEPWGRAAEGALARMPGLDRGAGRNDRRGRWTRAAAQAVAASAAAQAATLPLSVWHFQRVAALALPGTLLATPLVSLALPGALLALAAQAMHLPGHALLAGGVESLLWATRALMNGVAAWDPGWLMGPASVVVATGAGVAVWVLTRGRLGRSRRWAWALTGVASAILVGPWVTASLRPAELEIRLLDVGQGDAILIGTPGGRWVLVDTGPGSGERLARELASREVRRLELLVLTHPDQDHIAAAADLLRHFPVSAVADGGLIRGTETYARVVDAARRRGVPWRVLGRGTTWTLDGVSFTVLHPDPLDAQDREGNDRSVVIWVRWGEFDALLTGDVSREVEDEIVPMLGPMELLKVAHHGSRTSTGEPLLNRLRPALSLISVGADNQFGHPAPDVLARLERMGGEVLRTDLLGSVAVRARADGTHAVIRGTAGAGKPPN